MSPIPSTLTEPFSLVGAPLAGRLSDMIVIRARAKRGTWVPEDRLRASVPGVAILVPISILCFGLAIKFLPGTAGLVTCLVLLFIQGVGVRSNPIALDPCRILNANAERLRTDPHVRLPRRHSPLAKRTSHRRSRVRQTIDGQHRDGGVYTCH